MAQPGVGTCSIIMWDTKEKAKWWNMGEAGGIHLQSTHRWAHILFNTDLCVFSSCTRTHAWWRHDRSFNYSHTLSLNLFPTLCSSLLLCFSLPSIFFFMFWRRCSFNQKLRTCFKMYFDVNNTNLCFRTTTSYDGMEGPALQNIQLVHMNLCAKQDFNKYLFLLFSAKAT